MQWSAMEASLRAFDRGEIGVQALCSRWREACADIEQLPPRYGEVLQDLLASLESSAMFSEESCSFSVKDLRDGLQIWLDKARALQS